MKIETELSAGDQGFFLVNNEIISAVVTHVQVTQTTGWGNGRGCAKDPEVSYQLPERGDGVLWVPAKRAAKTKAELLAKL